MWPFSEVYSEPGKKYLRWNCYLKLLIIFAKRFISDVLLVSENDSDCYYYLLQYVQLLKSYLNGLLVVE